MKRILIAGAHSYIGDSVKALLDEYPDKYDVRIIDTKELTPAPDLFQNIDTVFCVAGIAHVRETNENRHLYYDVNRDLVVNIAAAAKEGGVEQFILLSSMSVYGLTIGHITKDTLPNPVSAYGESKLQADEKISLLEDDKFKFVCLRPPMVYGKNCAGNYQALREFALKSPVFPDYRNARSMIYIGNLCQFVKDCIDYERRGLFFPQNATYVNTREMVEQIARIHKKRIRLTKLFNWMIGIIPVDTVRKVFGDLTYEQTDTVGKYSFSESIVLTERECS